MASHHSDQELIDKRLAAYEAVWKKGSVDEILSFMAEDVSISDFGSSLLSLLPNPSPLANSHLTYHADAN
jgi:hypothetical protein